MSLTDTDYLSRFSEARVAVIGDVMLDVYVWGQVSRISPQAPVPIINVTKRTCCLGGASNVMRNLRTLGAKAYAYGVIGNDDIGKQGTCAEDEFVFFLIIIVNTRDIGRKQVRRELDAAEGIFIGGNALCQRLSK